MATTELSEAKAANIDGIDAGRNGYGFHNPINPWKRDVWRAWNDGFVEGQEKRRRAMATYS
jgi:hypothetical protein